MTIDGNPARISIAGFMISRNQRGANATVNIAASIAIGAAIKIPIKVTFKATGINTRESSKWSWKETDIYVYSHNSLRLIKINKTNLK